jgi:hypothetical protein
LLGIIWVNLGLLVCTNWGLVCTNWGLSVHKFIILYFNINDAMEM